MSPFVWKFVKVRRLNILTPFQDTKELFHPTYNFFFHQTSWDKLFIMDCENLFSIESHEIHLRIETCLFLNDLESKYFHMKSSLFFQLLVEFSSPVHEFGCSSHSNKFVSLSIFSILGGGFREEFSSVFNSVSFWGCHIRGARGK